jgi:hypothetical protein
MKFIPVFTNRKDISRDECRSRYAIGHAQLAATVPEFNRHMPKYVQNFVIDALPFQLAAPRIAGISENFFYSLEGFWNAFAEPRYSEFREDEARFADFDDLMLVFSSPLFIF